jgi:hypothetical protein
LSDSDSEHAVKKKRLENGGIKATEVKVPKPKPKPTVYKKGVWNPDVEVIDFDPNKESNSSDLIGGCCTRCTNRNAHRAALTGNQELLKKCVYATKEISSLNDIWSPHVKETLLSYLVEKG